MEQIGFIGRYDKTDVIIYVAKILKELGNKVLVLDTTQKQKTRYVVPAINPTISYITEFQGIDVAIGFENFGAVQEYLGIGDEELLYDYALVDLDSIDGANRIGLSINDKTYFVTAFDLYSLKKGVEILGDLKNPLKLTKVYFSRTCYNEDDEYLEFLALGRKVPKKLENGNVTELTFENKTYKGTVEKSQSVFYNLISCKGYSQLIHPMYHPC